ncbi:MAG TPA: DUF4244 domain-containing protein [Actinomycetota bacterium]|nr:DUF4244 domain-containing protein [Actinomycetota bacterium]
MDELRSFTNRICNGPYGLRWETGQTTAEYALVLLAAAAIALVLINWASGDNSALTNFFDGVISNLAEMAGIDGGGN